ncbi:MAG TPA: biotin/lipoyl-containing protein [Chloroflexia bacterium]|nr:biotin/lipoyl-containing protein [Chloroflexia bacterium]
MKNYVRIDGRELGFDVHHTESGTTVEVSEEGRPGAREHIDLAPVHASVETGEGLYSLIINGRSYQLYVEPVEQGFRIGLGRQRFDLEVLTEREWRLQKVAPRQAAHSGPLVVAAPMPGLVKAIHVAVGDPVAVGQRLLVLEAMKMENDITSPRDGTVAAINIQPGSVVEGGKPLISIES